MTLKALGAFLFETFKLVLVSFLIIAPIRYFVVSRSSSSELPWSRHSKTAIILS